MIDQAKDLYKLQQEASRIKQEMEQIHITADEEGVRITITGNMQVAGIEFDDDVDTTDKNKLSICLEKAFNRALKKLQEVMVERTMSMTGGDMSKLQEMMSGLKG